jgi:hypothetical protein
MDSLDSNKIETENRWSARQSVEFPVKIYRNGQLIGNSTINDISLEGVFIRHQGQSISSNSYIELEFDLTGNDESIHYNLPALIRHSSEKGIGAMFLHFSTGTFRHFHRILYEEPGIHANQKKTNTRWRPRKNVNLNLSIYQSGKKITDASTSNLSFEGVFIKTTLTPPLYSLLTVEFTLSDEGAEQAFQVPCLVRHRNNQGVGLMFLNFQLEKFNSLRRRLHERSIAPRQAKTDSKTNIPLLEKPVVFKNPKTLSKIDKNLTE